MRTRTYLALGGISAVALGILGIYKVYWHHDWMRRILHGLFNLVLDHDTSFDFAGFSLYKLAPVFLAFVFVVGLGLLVFALIPGKEQQPEQ